MTAGLVGYENMKIAAEEAGGSIHKGAAEGAVERRRKKLVGKATWFKGSSKQKTSPSNPPGRPCKQAQGEGGLAVHDAAGEDKDCREVRRHHPSAFDQKQSLGPGSLWPA